MRKTDFIKIYKRISPAFPGFAFKGSLLFVSPIDRLLRGIDLDPSGFDKTSFYINRFVLPLCVPKKHLTFTFGDRVLCSDPVGGWDACMPHLDEKLIADLKGQALPFLDHLNSLPAFIEHVEAGLRTARTLEALGYALVRVGRFERAVAVFDELLPKPDRSIEWQRELADRVGALRAEVIVDPKAAQARVIAIEAETVRNLGLQAFWKDN